MRHKLKAGLVVPYGRITAEVDGKGNIHTATIYQQGQIIPAGRVIIKTEPPELETVLGLKSEPKKTEAKKSAESEAPEDK